LLLLVIVSLVVAEIASNLMTRSLEALGGLTQNLPAKLSSPSPEIRWPESGLLESRHLISHFRVMAESLSEQFKKVQTANETLEQRVEERTHELLVSQEKFRTVADFAHDWEYWVAEDGSLPWMSPSCGRITGYSVEDFRQDPDLLYRICHPDDLPLLMDHVHEVPGEPGFAPLEFRIHHRDGHEVWFSHMCTPVWDDSGNPTGRRVTNRDITDRKMADIALRDSEARLLRAESVARIGNWELDLVEQKIRASLGATRIYGLQGDTWPLPEIQDLALPEYRPALDAALVDLLRRGRAFDVEYCIRRAGDGERRWIHSKAECDLARRTVFGVISDITERKKAERDLREREERYRTLIDNASEGILVHTIDGRALEVNKAFAQMHGYTSLLHNLESDLKTHVSVDHVVRKC
jgi:PAS domain S-box-containing protein